MNPNNRSGEPQWWVTVFKYNTLLESCFQLQVVSVSDYASKLQVFLTMQASFKCFWLCKQVSSVSDYASKLQVFLIMQASFRLCKQASSVSDYASKFQTMQASFKCLTLQASLKCFWLCKQARGRKREEEEGADTQGAGGQAVAQVDINSKTWCLPTSPTGTPKNEERTQTTQTPNIKIH